jgi:lysophospholipase L1-like esterase
MNNAPPRPLLVVTLTLACGLALSAFALAQVVTPDPSRFESEIAAFEKWDRKNSVPQNAVLFVGSSSIRMWPTAESFPNLPVINRGFGGSHISDVIHFAERIVLNYKPRTIVFYAGDNDIAAGKTPQQVAQDFQTFAALVHEQQPGTRIVYLPIKPSHARWKLWPQMQKANSLIQQMAGAHQHLDYVDTAAPMLGPDGQPRSNIFLDDGLHMNAAGYQLWTAKLSNALPSR